MVKKAGGIPIVRGNCPQSAMMYHTVNDVWGGVAKNPLDHERSCGGSSGGDGGLIVSRCVPLGFGSDIGGSLRYPAAFCGIYSLKPTSSRVSDMGVSAPTQIRFESFQHLKAVAGPMANSVEGLVLSMKAILDKDVHRHDPFQYPSAFNIVKYNAARDPKNFKNMKIGMLDESPFAPVSDAMSRAMLTTETALKELGFEVVKFSFGDEFWDEIRKMYICMFFNEPGKKLIDNFINEGESPVKQFSENFHLL